MGRSEWRDRVKVHIVWVKLAHSDSPRNKVVFGGTGSCGSIRRLGVREGERLVLDLKDATKTGIASLPF